MANQQLIDYIEHQLGQRASEEQIKQSLLANNWMQNDIEEAFNVIKKTSIEQPTVIFSDTEPKRKSLKIIGIFVLATAVVVVIACLLVGYMKTQGIKTGVKNSTEVAKESPEEIAKRLVLGSFLNNDGDFIDERSYCNSFCQETIQKNLGITFGEYLAWAQKIPQLNRKLIINKFEISSSDNNDNKATINYVIDYSEVDKKGIAKGGVTENNSLNLININGKWMTDESEGLDYAIPLIKNYQKLFSDLEKCQQTQKVEFDIPASGGTFTINDQNNPLNGFLIRFPKLKESMKISIGCSEFPPASSNMPYVSLPISIKADKDFSNLVDKKDLLFASLSISKVEADKTYGGKFPLIKIPYNDELIDKSQSDSEEVPSAFIEAYFDSKNPPTSTGFHAELDPSKNIATSFFTNLYETWVVLPPLAL